MRTAFAAIVPLVLPLGLAAQNPRPASAWNISLGAGTFVAPRYAGSDQHRVRPFPMMFVTYRDRIFLGPSSTGLGGSLGAYVVRRPRVGLVVELGMMDSRPSGRADALAGTDDRDALGTAGVGLSLATGPVRSTVSVSRGLNDGGGWLGIAGASFTKMLDRRFIVTTGVTLGLADARQLRRDFGVSDDESARRQALIIAGDQRLRPGEGGRYRPDGGVWQTGVSMSLTYLLSQQWSVLGFGGLSWLTDEVADSPLVRRREQASGGVGVMWRWP